MQAINRPFTGIINGSTQFVIPVFQRDYRWADEQCRQLWLDILRAAAAPAGRGHFLGSVVYIATGDAFAGFTRWLLIDGQQRVTTLTLLLAALRDHIRETGWQGGEDAPTATRIDAYFLQNSHEEGARRRKLVLRRRDDETLAAIITGSEMPREKSQRVIDAYEVFRDLVAECDPALVYAGIDKLVVVDVALDRQVDDPQLVFESLNSTGVDLSQSDLIRNFILMRRVESEQTRLYNDYWSKIEALFTGHEATFDAFLRDYFALKLRARKQLKADAIYAGFRAQWSKLCDDAQGIESFLGDMLRHARYYTAFALGRDAPAALQAALNDLRTLVDVPGLLVMRLFECLHPTGRMTSEEFVRAIRLIESFVMRRAICQEQTRGNWQIFAGLAYAVEDERPLDSLKVAMAMLRESYAFPSDASFEIALTSNNIYEKRVCSHLLKRLENHDTKEPSPVDTYSIEHIMPQKEAMAREWKLMLGDNWKNVHATWLHRLGNLTLTAYNSEYNARPFDAKKTMDGGFDHSAVRLNKYVREQSTWTEETMRTRGEQLAARALIIWPALVVPTNIMAEARERKLRHEAANTAGRQIEMSDTAAALYGQLRAAINAVVENPIEMQHRASVGYHGPEFFMEVLPRKRYLTLILPLDYADLETPPSIAGDTNDWKFIVNAQYDGGVYLSVHSPDDIAVALPLIAKAFSEANQ